MAQPRRIVILVVHGIGEQRRFSTLQDVAVNLMKALAKRTGLDPRVEVYGGDQAHVQSSTASWRESPVKVSWRDGQGRVEATFREVYWADLDYPVTFRRWFRLVWWALTMPGVRIFSLGDGAKGTQEGTPEDHGLVSAQQLTPGRRLIVRAQLGLICCPLFFILLLVNLIQVLLKRVSINWRLDRVLYDYLGDILLYQDWLIRESAVEGFGEKSRFAIRRRMVRTLVTTAAACEPRDGTAADYDGYYIFAHSLGTVVAFNALMEPAHVLPGYLTEEEWRQVPASWKTKATPGVPTRTPSVPLWLDPADAIDRSSLFGRLEGFLTVGSPLDKFAALWPAIVPVNAEALGKTRQIRWVNVSDVQDVVGASIDSFDETVDATGQAFALADRGFALTNWSWAGSWFLATAHTSYWTTHPSKTRLMDVVVDWLQGHQSPAPLPVPGRVWPTVFAVSVAVSVLLLFLASTFVVSYIPGLIDFFGVRNWIDASPVGPFVAWLQALTFWQLLVRVVAASVAGVVLLSLSRRLYERWLCGRQYLRPYKKAAAI